MFFKYQNSYKMKPTSFSTVNLYFINCYGIFNSMQYQHNSLWTGGSVEEKSNISNKTLNNIQIGKHNAIHVVGQEGNVLNVI